MSEFDRTYWVFNLPLQLRNAGPGKCEILNYMPRRERCEWDAGPTPEQMPEFCEKAAKTLENLAALFRLAGEGKIDRVYYASECPAQAVADCKANRREVTPPAERPAGD